MTTKKNNNVSGTKVICQNCGAEVIIPNHEHPVTGIAIGKDSGLGTIVLPTKDTATQSPAQQLAALTGGNAEVLKVIVGLVEKIEDSGYLDVDGIVRRWIPSQCLGMVYSKKGFHAALLDRGYDYSWKVIVDEMKKQAKLYRQNDTEGYVERNRWYNAGVAYIMAERYIASLRKRVDGLKARSHEGRRYKKIVCHWMNSGKGVHIDELEVFYNVLGRIAQRIKSAKNPKTVYEAVANFDKLRKQIKYTPSNKEICGEFINAYKAAGCYYTIKDLIMFEGCLLQTDKNGTTDEPSYWERRNGKGRSFVQKEESLAALERTAGKIVSAGVTCCGYMMLGLLKDFLAYNKFDLASTKQKWNEQSELRKAVRSAKRGERRSRK